MGGKKVAPWVVQKTCKRSRHEARSVGKGCSSGLMIRKRLKGQLVTEEEPRSGTLKGGSKCRVLAGKWARV